MLAELYVLTGKDAGRGLTAGMGPSIFMGRAATNQLRIRDPAASRVHCRLDVTTDGLVLHDNNSGNGTYVNDVRVTTSRRLDDNDEIRVGATRIKVLLETEDDQARWGDRSTPSGSEELAISASASASEARPRPIRNAPRDNDPAHASAATLTPIEGKRKKRRALREVLPGYRFETRLGGHSREGMAVYRALQRSLDRNVALKVLLAKGSTSKSDVSRFLREARAIARLPHPNIVTIHDVVKRGNLNVIVMEYLAGGSLADRIDEGKQSIDSVLVVGEAIGAALAYAHDHDVVHRGVKPSNVLYAPNVDTYKLADFGFVTDPGGTHTGDTCFLTTPLAGLGYLAPEQVVAEDGDGGPDARTDVYGLGATLYACAAGRAPFGGDSVAEVASAVLRDDPDPLPSKVPGSLKALIERCLAKDPADRYPDCRALITEIGACRTAWSAHAVSEDAP